MEVGATTEEIENAGREPSSSTVRLVLSESLCGSTRRTPARIRACAFSCDRDGAGGIALAVGDKSSTGTLDAIGVNSLFLSVDPGSVGPSGCTVAATVSNDATGTSDASRSDASCTCSGSVPWPPPSPHAPLYVWLRGEREGRATQAKY